jgi:hypothetical protein
VHQNIGRREQACSNRRSWTVLARTKGLLGMARIRCVAEPRAL